MKKRLLCAFLALIMICSMIPFGVLADVVIVNKTINYTVLCFINMQGGTAYDAAGNQITQAMPGTEVIIVADAPAFGFQFDQWMIMGNAEVSIADVNSITTTFIMPDCDITIFSGYGEAPKVPLESVQFSLYGYYMNANAECLQLKTTSPVNFVQNSVTNLDYIVLANNASANLPTETQVTGALRNTAKHWIAFAIEPEFGYSLANLTVDMISISWAEEIRLMECSQDYALIFALAPNPGRALSKNSITVNNGTAYVNNTIVTSAVPNLVVRIEADEPPAGQYFSGWRVISGNVVLEDSVMPATTFVMGLSAVELEPIYTDPIDFVAVQIQEPVAGMTPSYLAWIESEGIERDENNNIYCRNGVIWYDVDTEENLDPNTAVFEPGHTYGVQILLKTTPGMVFALNEKGHPAVTGSVNDATDYVTVDSYTQESSTQVVLTTFFDIEEDAEIAEPVSQITLTDLDAPVVGQPFDYTYNWDYMQYVSPSYSMDGDYTLNGVTWIDVTDPQNPTLMIPEVSVAIEGHTYCVEMLVGTTNYRVFSLNEALMPEGINATLNGETCNIVTQNGLHPTRVLKLMYHIPTSPVIEWNVLLSDNIGINFIADLKTEDIVTATINGKTTEIVKTENSDGTYKLCVKLAAAQMTDEIKLMINGTPLITTYSVRKYADYILYDNSYGSCHELVKAMLAYGGAAQNYFDYKTDNLADSGYTVTPLTPTGTASVPVSGSVNGISFHGASLVFKDKIAVRFYFNGEIDKLIFGADGTPLTPVAKGDMYYVEAANINPQDLGTDITVTVTKGTENLSVVYSPLAYMIRMYEKTSSSDTTKALMQALYGYYQAAVAYTAK